MSTTVYPPVSEQTLFAEERVSAVRITPTLADRILTSLTVSVSRTFLAPPISPRYSCFTSHRLTRMYRPHPAYRAAIYFSFVEP